MIRKTAAALAALAIAAGALAPLPASADQRGYAHVHQSAPQPAVDPATAAMIGLGIEILEEVIKQKRIERKKKCYDSWGYYIC